MKPKEKEIIKHLRKGKRLNISEIARELNLPISTVNDAIKRIEKKYVIKRSSLLDYKKIGYNANAKIAVKVSSERKRDFLKFLKEQNCVNSVYHINSGFDFLIDVICRDIIELKFWIDDVKKDFSLEVIMFQILKVEKMEAWVP
ncbi:MAG: Lrp/AsnC family transcriptional regulator [Candidatus Woesearchaeota archaeon]